MYLKIGICDGDKKDLQSIYQITRDTISRIGRECEIITFGSGEEMLPEIYELDLMIMDVELPGVTGIEIKEKLQWDRTNRLIIFVSDYVEKMKEAFGFHALSFITKREMEQKLSESIEEAIYLLGQYVYLDGGLDSRMVKYIKSDHSYCNLYLKNGRIKRTRVSMKQYEEILTKVDFLHIHKSYLINLRYVDKITETHVWIWEEKLPIATRLIKEVQQKYLEYVMKNKKGKK